MSAHDALSWFLVAAAVFVVIWNLVHPLQEPTNRTPECPVCSSTPKDTNWRWDAAGHRWIRWTPYCQTAWQQVRDGVIALRA